MIDIKKLLLFNWCKINTKNVEIQNLVKELSRQGSAPIKAHRKLIHLVFQYYVAASKRGSYLKPIKK